MNSYYRTLKIKLKYYSRVIRSEFLRILWYIFLPIFAIERFFRQPKESDRKKILIIVIGGMGDTLLFDPLFRRLKEQWPQSTIDVITGVFGEMWERIGSVDHLYYLKSTKFKPPWNYLNLFRKIYLNQYDIVAEGISMLPPRGIYPVLPALIFKVSQAPVRVGRIFMGLNQGMRIGIDGFRGQQKPIEKTVKNNPILTHMIRLEPPDKRDYHESAKVFEPLNINFYRKKNEPKLYGNVKKDTWARTIIRNQWASNDDIVIGFSIETTRKIKSWPINNFLSILEWGIRDHLKFVLIGLQKTPPESPLKQFSNQDLLNLSSHTTLGEMISVIQQCDIFLSCDTGPSHIAQACRIPSIVLFGPSNEKEFGPVDHDLHTLVLPPAKLDCRPCVLGPCLMGNTCMNLIQPETVYELLKKKTQTCLPSKVHGDNRQSHQPPKILIKI